MNYEGCFKAHVKHDPGLPVRLLMSGSILSDDDGVGLEITRQNKILKRLFDFKELTSEACFDKISISF